MAKESPTSRTLKHLRSIGYTAAVTERWNQFAKVRQDLFGVVDVLAIGNGHTLAVQACAGSSHSARRAKILAHENTAKILAAGWKLEVWSWAKQGANGERKTWKLRIEQIQPEDIPATPTTGPAMVVEPILEPV